MTTDTTRFKVRSGAAGAFTIAMIRPDITPKFIAFLRDELKGAAFSGEFNQTADDGYLHDRFELSSTDHPGIDIEYLSARFRC